MAEATNEAEDGKASGSKSGLLLWLVIVVVGIGGGVATPLVIAQLGSGTADKKTEPLVLDPNEDFDFVEFGEISVNLDEARFSRYLKLKFVLQVPKSQKMEVEKQLAAKRAILKNWLNIHISEKSTENLEGKFGRNSLRREIHDYFNKVLFDDGIERIQDVLFDEFHVQ